MQDLKDFVLSKRPNLSNSSLITYTTILKNLYHKVFGNDVNFNNFDNSKDILHCLKDMAPNKRKNNIKCFRCDHRQKRVSRSDDARI